MNSTSTHAGVRRAAPLVGLASLALIIGGGLMLAEAASAAYIDVPASGSPGRLVLSSDPYPAQFLSLSPGDPAYWEVRARLEDATEATLALELWKSGDLVEHPRGLTMIVDSCTQDWTQVEEGAPACARGAERIAVATPADDYSDASPTFQLTALASDAPRHLLVTLQVEDSPAASADESLMGLVGDMGVRLTATAIDDVPVTPPGADPAGSGTLPSTGAMIAPLLATAAIAAGLLGLGAALRRPRKETSR